MSHRIKKYLYKIKSTFYGIATWFLSFSSQQSCIITVLLLPAAHVRTCRAFFFLFLSPSVLLAYSSPDLLRATSRSSSTSPTSLCDALLAASAGNTTSRNSVRFLSPPATSLTQPPTPPWPLLLAAALLVVVFPPSPPRYRCFARRRASSARSTAAAAAARGPSRDMHSSPSSTWT